MDSTNRGRWGEDIAANHLQTEGYKLVEQNWRYKKLEIDLIVCTEKLWVFVEVKTRKTGYLESALDAVDLRKQQRIIKAAHQFICRSSKNPSRDVRFDIVCIEYDRSNWRIQHIIDAFISLP